MDRRGREAIRMRDGYLRGSLSRPATQRQMDVLAAFVAAGGSVQDAAELVGIRPSTVKRHLADLRARSRLSTEQLIYAGRVAGGLSSMAWSPPEPPGRVALSPGRRSALPRVGPIGGGHQRRSRRPARAKATRIGTPASRKGSANPTPRPNARGVVAMPSARPRR